METELRACGGQLESEGGTITIHGCAGALHAPEQQGEAVGGESGIFQVHIRGADAEDAVAVGACAL